jgi:hypothetical protein
MAVQPPAPPQPPGGDQAVYMEKVLNSSLTDEQKVSELKKWISKDKEDKEKEE